MNVQRFRDGLVFKDQRLCVSLNSRRESNEEEEDIPSWDQIVFFYCLDLHRIAASICTTEGNGKKLFDPTEKGPKEIRLFDPTEKGWLIPGGGRTSQPGSGARREVRRMGSLA